MTKLPPKKPPKIENDLPRRSKAWYAMSDLFLDTELSNSSINYVADELNSLGYNMEELEYIFWQEVYPALIGNLLCLTGAWGAFYQEDVINAILKKENRFIKLRLSKKLKPFSHVVAKDWNKVKELLKV